MVTPARRKASRPTDDATATIRSQGDELPPVAEVQDAMPASAADVELVAAALPTGKGSASGTPAGPTTGTRTDGNDEQSSLFPILPPLTEVLPYIVGGQFVVAAAGRDAMPKAPAPPPSVDNHDVSTPIDADGAAGGAVVENAAVGTAVGITARASDADATNNGITYSLSSNPNGLFQIDPTSGVVSTAADIDRETHGATRTIKVTATSADGSTSEETFTIAIEDVNEAATASDSDASPNVVSENLAAGSAVGITLVARDPDSAGGVDAGATFRVIGGDSDLFEVDDQGVVRTARRLDREADGVSRSITIETTDSSGLVTLSQHTIAIGDVGIDPGFVLPPQVLEGEGYWVAPSIVGSNEAVTWSMEGADAFTIVREPSNTDAGLTTGSVRLIYPFGPGGQPLVGIFPQDFEAQADANRDNVYEVTLVATGASGWEERQTLQITVQDRNEPVSAVADADTATANRVDEEVALNTYVGFTARAVDPDHTNNTVTYRLLNDAGGLLRIDDRTGEVFTNGRINFEAITGGVLSGVVQASSSGGGAPTTLAFQVTVGNINEPLSQPTDVNNAVNYVFDSHTAGAEEPVGITVQAADPDAGTTVTYAFAEGGNPDGLFKIDPNTGVVTTSGLDIDEDDHGDTRTITVVATSSDGSSSTQDFAVDIVKNDHSVTTPANTDTTGTAEQVLERAGAGTYVGISVSASDADDTFNDVRYYLTDDGDADGLFTIDPVSGRVTTTGKPIDLETQGSTVVIEVEARGADFSTARQSYDITINDVPHIITGLEMVDIEVTPGGTTVRGFEVDEYIEPGTDSTGVLLGTLALDEINGDDAPAGLQWALAETDDWEWFALDPTTGALTFYRGDFEDPGDSAGTDAAGNNVFVTTVEARDQNGVVVASQQVTVVQRNVGFSVVVAGQTGPFDPSATISVDVDEMQTGQVQLQVIGDVPDGNLTWSNDFVWSQSGFDLNDGTDGLVRLVVGQDFETLRDEGYWWVSFADADLGSFPLQYGEGEADDGVLSIGGDFLVTDEAGNTGRTLVQFNIYDVPEIYLPGTFNQPTENDDSWSLDLNLSDTPPGVQWSIGTLATDGADGTRFDIDPVGGVLTLREPLDSEYEPDGGVPGVYAVTVVASASNGTSARANVGVLPEDVALAINGSPDELFTVLPGAGGQVIKDFDLSASGDMATGTTHWEIVQDDDDDSDMFSVDENGQVTFDPGTTAHDANDGHGTDGNYIATLRVWDEADQEDTVRLQVDIVGPPDLNINWTEVSDGLRVFENTPDAVILTAELVSTQELGVVSWSLADGPDRAQFAIHDDGTLIMHEQNYESGQHSFSVTLVGTDGRGYSVERPVTVNLDDAPLEIVTSARRYQVDEETSLTIPVSLDPYISDVNWSFSGADEGQFTWSQRPDGDWDLVLAPKDFESTADLSADGDHTYTITLTATGDATLTDTRTLTVVVNDVDESAAAELPPTDPADPPMLAGAELPSDAGSAPPPGWDPSQPLPPRAFVPPSDLEFIHVAPPLMFG